MKIVGKVVDWLANELRPLFDKTECPNCQRRHQRYEKGHIILVSPFEGRQTCDHPECAADVEKANSLRMETWSRSGAPGGTTPTGGLLPGAVPAWLPRTSVWERAAR
jgi:hypothetical protein